MQALLVMLLVALLIFVMLRIVPGNPVAVLMGEHGNQETIDRMSKEMGLNEPVLTQFFRYIGNSLKGDFGTSISMGKPVGQLMAAAFGNTLILALGAALFAWVFGGICGIIAAAKKGKIPDHLFMGFSLLGISMPVFMVAMLLQYLFAYHLHWLPISGNDSWRSFILPAVALGWNSAGSIARLVRSTLLDTLEDDYIDTARAKGLGRMAVLFRHALRNAMLPIVTMMALQLSALLSGAVITETIFSINGIGRLAVQAIGSRDIPLLQGTALFTTALVILGNLAADGLYRVLDPRIRKGA